MQYPRRDQVAADVIAVLDYYTTLHPEKSDFNYDDGRVELLLGVHGVLPVSLRGNVYNCPLAIWLPLDYPTKPPIVLIQPTNTMQIKPGSNVDRNGRVSVPYMKDWGSKAEGCSMMTLIEILIALFSRDYPLVSIASGPPKPNPPPPPPPLAGNMQTHQGRTGSPAPLPPRPPAPAGPLYRPMPPQVHSRSASVNSDTGNAQPPPPRPPIPGMAGPPAPYGQYNSSPAPPPPPAGYGPPQPPIYQQQQMSSQHQPSGSSSGPPRPPPPPATYGTPPAGTFSSAPAQYGSPAATGLDRSSSLRGPSQFSSNPPFPPDRNEAQYQPPPHPNHDSQQAPYRPHPNSKPSHQSHYAHHPPYGSQDGGRRPDPSLQHAPPLHATPPPPHQQQLQQHQFLPPSSQPAAQSRPQPRQSSQKKAINILDGPEDDDSSSPTSSTGSHPPSSTHAAPPPRPPNPEILALRTRLHSKLSHHLSHLSASTTNEIERLDVLGSDLEKGEPAVKDEMQRLEAVRDVCATVVGRYKEVVEMGEGRLREYEMRGEGPEVDEIVCSSTVVYNQLLELVAEDAALEDTIYHLGRALNSESANLDLDKFLKRVRGLAREQFMKRALINKSLLALAARQAQRAT